MFGFFRRKKARPLDPLEAFDALIEQLERQSAHLRQSAATLLSLQGELKRTLERYESQREALRQRAGAAGGDVSLMAVLESDGAHLSRQEAATREALARAVEDGAVLLDAAQGIARQLSDLKLERTSASVRLKAGSVLSGALQEQVARFDQVLAVDAARDEVERAHQLAQIYREDRRRSG